MNTTAGHLHAGSNSALFASFSPTTLRAYSMTASCMPRQMPKYGIRCSRAYLAARIFPSTPRSPNPPGTRMPSARFSLAQASSYVRASLRSCSGWSSSAATQIRSSLWPAATAACSRALRMDRYESESPVYLPTTAMPTFFVSVSSRSARSCHWVMSGVAAGRRSAVRMALTAPCFSMTRGTCQMFDTSWRVRMCSGATWQKEASFALVESSRGSWLRHASRWGLRPRARSSRTLCWVGLVFCSPTTPRVGTRLTWMLHRLPSPMRNWNCRSASTKGIDSMSPTVPPSSITVRSGAVSPATGTLDTRSIQSWMASVMWGTTCTVLPR
mmetsp:Transcript_3181/g.11503  ORF Transcript_3181/g.11503 Transcript_3181/m.11503 type:complete len:327 (+) Transcript_3181:525-1505(+)